ncbi:DUF692 domain-containing protein [Devosia sp.]|uniref:DUF692 domain-containing protein n=1 Tax=Devosia sp. TaxID=1871048 RepID=UPI0039C8641E
MDALHQSYHGKRIHLHSTALSVASAELNTDEVDHIARLCHRYGPDTVSDHLSFRTAGDLHLENFIPPLLDAGSRELVRRNVEAVQQACGMRLDLENVTHLIGDRELLLRERDFLMELCESSSCGMVFDVNNLFIDCHNYQFDAQDYLDGLDLGRIATFHVAGFALDRDGQYVDTHMERISDGVLSLLGSVVTKLPVQADVLLERDNGSATRTEILSELARIRTAVDLADGDEPAACCGACGSKECANQVARPDAAEHRRLVDLPL